jgi:hypothetical protein
MRLAIASICLALGLRAAAAGVAAIRRLDIEF